MKKFILKNSKNVRFIIFKIGACTNNHSKPYIKISTIKNKNLLSF